MRSYAPTHDPTLRLARIVRALTPEPRVETVEVDGVPTEPVLPAGVGSWPAFHLVNGAHPERRQEPIVRRVTHGLARAGFVVALPDLPGLGEGELTRLAAADGSVE